MELMEDPMFKIKYQKCKLRVKLWESDFMDKYGRRPNKCNKLNITHTFLGHLTWILGTYLRVVLHGSSVVQLPEIDLYDLSRSVYFLQSDIKDANATIKEAYKMYWKLKTRALEETLIDITFSDDARANVIANALSSSKSEEAEAEKVTESTSNNTENINPRTSDRIVENDSEKSLTLAVQNVEGAWGDHLSHTKEVLPTKKQNLLIGRASSFQLSRKMFTATSFTKRNPRKSLSLTKMKSKSDLNSAPSESGRETISQKEDGFRTIDIEIPIFGEKANVTRSENKSNVRSIGAVQNLLEGRVLAVGRNIDRGWLERCSKENDLESIPYDSLRFSGVSDSGIEMTETSIYSPCRLVSTPSIVEKSSGVSDEEDFIYNSDSEEERKNERTRATRKRSSDGEFPNAKRPRLETGSELTSGELAGTETLTVPATRVSVETNEREISKITMAVREGASEDTSLQKSNFRPVGSTIVRKEKTTKTTDLLDDDIEHESPAPPSQSLNNAGRIERGVEQLAAKRVATRLKTRRKIRSNSSDDSDSDYNGADSEKKTEKPRKPKRISVGAGKKSNAKKPTKHRKSGTKKSENTKEESNLEKFPKPLKTTTKKKGVVSRNSESEADETEETTVPIYGIETLEATPRCALPATSTGDLIADFSQIVLTPDETRVVGKTGAKLTDKEKLERKVAAGNVNENFVRINLKKKVYVRGKKTMNFSKYKKNQWKQRKKELSSGEGSLDLADLAEKNGVLTCFKCGDVGHFSRNCKALKSDDLLPLEDVDESSEYPTLEEAERMASEAAFVAHAKKIDRLPQRGSVALSTKVDASEGKEVEEDVDESTEGVDFSKAFDSEEDEIPKGHRIPADLVAKLLPPEAGTIQPLYIPENDHSLRETPAEVFDALHKFGHENFRPGQEKAVMRILSGQSTLVTLSTGSGKSLCYQLPAYLYARQAPCITLVISPLVSLMDDQVTGVPAFLSAACLHTGQTPKLREMVMEKVRQGELDILLVSPEAVVAGEKSTGFGALLRQLPPIAFACIDEAHCISQWSHNFRPSYLMVCRVLKEKLGVKTILALTATATKGTAESIVNHLNIHDGLAGVIADTPLPKNLTLSVSRDEQRETALIRLLRSERFKECDSIIIYCTRREVCVRIAALLRTALQDSRDCEKTAAKVSSIAEAYHAGLSAYRRKAVQKAFMNGSTRIVVATVAFGMGINKADIRAVIHYNMPSSFEGYVQEVGRSGRDGLPAYCHLFLNSKEGGDKNELQRHIYANGIDRHVVRRLLQKVFVPCSCAKIANRAAKRRCPGHEVAIPVDETVKALDIPEETIATLLCYLELHPKRFITVLSSVYVMARVTSYSGSKALKAAAQSCPPLAMAIALDQKKRISHENSSMIEFPVVDVAAAIGWDSGVAKSHLKNLEWTTVNGKSKRSSISVKYDTLGLRVRAPGDLSDAELDEALEVLARRAESQELSRLRQLETIDDALNKVSFPSIQQCLDLEEECVEKSEALKVTIRDYFQSESPLSDVDPKVENKLANEAQIASDVRSLVSSYRDDNFTGRAIARIFHGIQSPNYPALVWSRCRFWRAHLGANFNLICQVATREILAMR